MKTTSFSALSPIGLLDLQDKRRVQKLIQNSLQMQCCRGSLKNVKLVVSSNIVVNKTFRYLLLPFGLQEKPEVYKITFSCKANMAHQSEYITLRGGSNTQ